MYSLHRLATFPIHHVKKGLILAGGAAGLAAAFNTPLAGVMFAIEEMSRSFEERITGSLMVAVILAGMTALMIQGNYTYFGTYTSQLDPWHSFGIIAVAGIVGGAAGGLFSTILIAGGRRLKPFRSRHPYLLAAILGLAVALVGILSGNATWGTGYEAARGVLQGTDAAAPWYAPLKFLATVFSYLSGIPGGIFAPSLSVGAGFGHDLSALFPAAPVVAVGLLGMVGYFSGVVQTPITAVTIVMEMTDDHRLLLPLMATALLANGVSRLVCRESIYQAMSRDFLSAIRAQQAMDETAETSSRA
jgi:H+/Cl- antiporter ClcA